MTEKKDNIQEIQILEQTLQNILLQKQAFQMELLESQSALKELNKSGDEVFKIVGQLMIKTTKDSIKKELSDKEKLIELRLKSLENQEKSLSEKIEESRKDILKD